MPNILDYLVHEGMLPIEQAPFGEVDVLVLSALSYIRFGSLLTGEPRPLAGLGETAAQVLALPGAERDKRLRRPSDAVLLRSIADSPRFAPCRLGFYIDHFAPENEMQFAAMTIWLPDGSAFAAFRGTDATLVGWKEDFNMSFSHTVPAQRAAQHYTEKLAAGFLGPLRLGGHSKGGNLAVYAATQCAGAVRRRVQMVYNNDGPGFTDTVLSSPGYAELLPRVRTFVPQSSVVGMLLEHEGAYTVVQSSQVGLLQHEPYSWQVREGRFVRLDEVTAGSRMVDRTLKNWLAGMTPQEREHFIDTVYEMLSAGDAHKTAELMLPRNVLASLRAFGAAAPADRRMLRDRLRLLLHAAMDALKDV